jgi:hypothetical protein
MMSRLTKVLSVSEENKYVEEEAREGSINIKDSIKYFLA